MSVTLQAVWIIKRMQYNAPYSPSYISRVISMCVHRRQCSAAGCDGRPGVTEIANAPSVALRPKRTIAQSHRAVSTFLVVRQLNDFYEAQQCSNVTQWESRRISDSP
jgi:hypothetical protein